MQRYVSNGLPVSSRVVVVSHRIFRPNAMNCPGQPSPLRKSASKAVFMCTFCLPGCIFGHVNGVLRIFTRVKICIRVQICSYFRGGTNPGANCAHERKMFNFGDFDLWLALGLFSYTSV